MIASPSPRTIASIAPSAWSSTCRAMKDTEWPPANTKQPGRAALTARARSMTSGTLAR